MVPRSGGRNQEGQRKGGGKVKKEKSPSPSRG